MKQLLSVGGIIPLFFITIFVTSLFSCPSEQEVNEVFTYSNKVKEHFDSEELSNIEVFLSNPKVIELLFNSPKLNITHQKAWTNEEKKENDKRSQQIMELLKQHRIINKSGTDSRLRNLTIESQRDQTGDSLFPSLIVKIQKLRTGHSPFEYQNISRVWYSKLISDIVENHGLKHIRPVKKCFLHVPTQPSELSDKNYVVVCEKINPLYSRVGRGEKLQELLIRATRGDRNALRLIAEMLFVIKKAGLWDITLQNILFVEKNKVAFIDTEKSWKYDDPEMLQEESIAQFAKILCGVPHFICGKKDKELEKKGIAIENKLLQFKGDGDLATELRQLLPRW